MGNVCCGSKEEQSKGASAFSFVEGSRNLVTDMDDVDGVVRDGPTDSDVLRGTVITTTVSHNDDGSHVNYTEQLQEQQQQEEEKQRRQQQQDELEETMKCQRIVQSTGRAMVSVSHSNMSRRDRNTIYYSDQGFAAALAQHLEQKMNQPPTNTPTTSQQLQSVNMPSSTTNATIMMMLPPVPKEIRDRNEVDSSSVESRNRQVYDIMSQPVAYDPLLVFEHLFGSSTTGSTDPIHTTRPSPTELLTNNNNDNSTTTTTLTNDKTSKPPVSSGSNSRNHQQRLNQLCEHIVLDHVVRPTEHLLDAKLLPPLIENLL